jgi:soluble lytic murein transglycosylase-like protein
MAYNRDVTGLQSTLSMIEQIKDPQRLQQIAQQYQQQPNGGAIIAAALAQAQKLQRIKAGMQAQQAPQGQQGQQQEPPVVNEAIASINPRELPEDSGIARLPAGNMDFAEGGIVAFAGGKKVVGDFEQQIRDEAERQGVDPDLMVRMFATESGGNPKVVSPKGAAGLGQLMPAAAQDMGLTPEDRFDPAKNIPASVGYFKKQLGAFGGDPEKAAAAYNWGPGAMNKHLATKPDNWKLGLPKETAKYLTSLLPMGSAQAAPPAAPQAPPTEDAPSIYSGPGFTPEGLEALGQRLDVIREARGKAKPPSLRDRNVDPDAAKRFEALQNLNLQSQREYEKYAENIYNKPAFAAQAAGGKGVGTTTMPEVQTVAKEAAAQDIARQEAGAPWGNQITDRDFADVDSPPRAAPPPPMPSKKDAIEAVKDALPASERKGWTDDMLMQFFLGMAAGESPNAITNAAKAGLGALKYGQEAKKAETEREKDRQAIRGSQAEARYKTAQALSLESGDKPLAQYLKAVDTALAGLAKDDTYAMAKPAEKAAMENKTRQRVLATYAQHYPELLSTMGAGGDEFKVLGSR